MKWYKIKTIENLTATIEGVFYVEGWETFYGKYQISSFGRVKRIGYTTKTFNIYKPPAILSQGGGRYLKKYTCGMSFTIHRLVGMYFIPNPENKPQINHKDLDKWNNHVSNLEWATQSENIVHGQVNGVFPYAKPKPPLKKKWEKNMKGGTYKPIIDLNTGIFYTSNELAFLLDTRERYICRMLNEERKPNKTQYRYA